MDWEANDPFAEMNAQSAQEEQLPGMAERTVLVTLLELLQSRHDDMKSSLQLFTCMQREVIARHGDHAETKQRWNMAREYVLSQLRIVKDNMQRVRVLLDSLGTPKEEGRPTKVQKH